MVHDTNPEGNEEKQRRDLHFARQKALLTSGTYSDLTITCGPRTWHVHKAILCPTSGFFARAVNFGKEQSSNTIDLPHDDPDIVSLLLDYVYTLDYDVNGVSDAEDAPQQESVWFVWSAKDELSRTERRRLQEGMYRVNEEGMQEAVRVTKEEFPEIAPSSRNFLDIYSSDITPHYLARILAVFSSPVYCTGNKFYTADDGDDAITHAKIYCLADKYDVPSLQTLAFARLTEDVIHCALDSSVVVQALTILLENTPEEDGRARKMVIKCLEKDMRGFGIRKHNRRFFQKFPELHEWFLRWTFGEEDEDEEEEEDKDGKEKEEEEVQREEVGEAETVEGGEATSMRG